MKKKKSNPVNDPTPGNSFQALWQMLRRWPFLRACLIILVSLVTVSATAWGFLPVSTKNAVVKWVRTRLRPTVAVGSMDFPEQRTVGEVIAQMLEAKGINVERNFDQNSELLRRALEGRNIDCYLEYTGVPYTLVFKQKPIPDEITVYNYLKEHYEDKNIEVSQPFHFQTEWAILIRGKDALDLDVHTISEASKFASNWRAGYIPDFQSDVTGAEGLKRTYNLKFKSERIIPLPSIYGELNRNAVDIISGSSTDSEIETYDFKQLKDDLHNFPPYQPIILARRETLDRVPALREVMVKLPEIMTLDEMKHLNLQVRTHPEKMKEIVQTWLQTNGFK
jgi:glycine betaine/choline ABC-type transport system substrate-binding protein